MTSGNAPPEGYGGGAFLGPNRQIVSVLGQILSQLLARLALESGSPAVGSGRGRLVVNGQ